MYISTLKVYIFGIRQSYWLQKYIFVSNRTKILLKTKCLFCKFCSAILNIECKYVLFEQWRLTEPVLIYGSCSTKQIGETHPQEDASLSLDTSLRIAKYPFNAWVRRGPRQPTWPSFEPQTFQSIGRRSNH